MNNIYPYLYKKNNFGRPCCWRVYPINDGSLVIEQGVIGKSIKTYTVPVTKKDKHVDINSRYNEKRKQGYIALEEIKDDGEQPPVGGVVHRFDDLFISYLTKYLPDNLVNANTDAILPMLAKTHDINSWDKRKNYMLGQPKFNGLRCLIRAVENRGDLFKPYKIIFQSREGVIWETLTYLEDYIITNHRDIVEKMVYDEVILDGEIYLHGYSVNEINHFVKDPNCKENKLLKFYCYDIAVEDLTQSERNDYRQELLKNSQHGIILYVPSVLITSAKDAINFRNQFINEGFEGLILRNPTVEYQFGRRRVNYMEKFKAATDGKFKILDIIRGDRDTIDILICENDINEEQFEVTYSVPKGEQSKVYNKEHYIGKLIELSFGERSGVKKVPFHIKDRTIID